MLCLMQFLQCDIYYRVARNQYTHKSIFFNVKLRNSYYYLYKAYFINLFNIRSAIIDSTFPIQLEYFIPFPPGSMV